jgi:epoxyqueuosine reductase
VFAGSPIKRIGRGRMVRNAAIAAGNSGLPELAPALERLTADEDPVVAEAAAWGLEKLNSSPAFAGEGDQAKPGGGVLRSP